MTYVGETNGIEKYKQDVIEWAEQTNYSSEFVTTWLSTLPNGALLKLAERAFYALSATKGKKRALEELLDTILR